MGAFGPLSKSAFTLSAAISTAHHHTCFFSSVFSFQALSGLSSVSPLLSLHSVFPLFSPFSLLSLSPCFILIPLLFISSSLSLFARAQVAFFSALNDWTTTFYDKTEFVQQSLADYDLLVVALVEDIEGKDVCFRGQKWVVLICSLY